MRVIKLSSKDPDMKTPEMVKVFFSETLAKRQPLGQFFLTAGRISERGIKPGERLLFTYNSQCVYEARSATGRINNEDRIDDRYPFYFCVDVASIVAVSGSLEATEQKLSQLGLLHKSLVHSQGWPKIDETEAFRSHIDSILDEIRQENQL